MHLHVNDPYTVRTTLLGPSSHQTLPFGVAFESFQRPPHDGATCVAKVSLVWHQ